VIRAAQKEGHQRIAVVTGAWHAPALAASGSARVDRDLLKALPKIKVEATWIPWTNSRLALHSGYGAGVTSPGWYAHLWRYGERAQVVWTTEAARLLRREDLDASSASVIETVRLADALAALRELPMPGLTELREAIESVLVAGDVARLALIRHRLEVGDAIGEVPDHGRQVPIMRDFQRQVKSLRLTLSPELSTLDLDLRRENDLARSRLLHRLTILDVRWGSPLQTGRGAGTFREAFQLRWEPELAVALIAANLHGNTVDVAAVRALIERARAADLPQLTQLIERALRAELPAAIDPLLRELDARAASSSDVRTQMEALEPLVRVARYGDVRGTRAEHVLPVLHALFERIVVSLAPACAQLDDDAVAAMVAAIGRAHQACLLLEDQSLCGDWLDALAKLAAGAQSHARVRGRGARLLFEQGRLESAELLRHASLALSASVEPARAAQWIEGLMEGEAMLLVHQTELLGVLDSWVVQLPAPAFQAMLPLLRRAFSSLSPAERRSVARGVRTRGGASGQVASSAAAERLDPARMKRIVPVLAQVLGVDHA
ncbi:MAG TPA: DUF5682 family protein, partial [Polyangiales bacterium]